MPGLIGFWVTVQRLLGFKAQGLGLIGLRVLDLVFMV